MAACGAATVSTRSEHALEHLLGRERADRFEVRSRARTVVPGAAQQLDQRRVAQRLIPECDTASGMDHGAGGARLGRELGDQARLPGAGVTAHEQGAAGARGYTRTEVAQQGQLRFPPDEKRRGRRRKHWGPLSSLAELAQEP